ncbi:MAG: thiaminase II, partial [Nitrospirae bacterium]|nr:thiaminase II [Nitrospirota bacterium]
CVIGQHLLRNGPPSPKHPYRDWLLMYGSPEFAAVTKWMRALIDQEAKHAGKREQERMIEAFVTSSRYEWMFWEMAWKEEQWPI